jgi:hypothetical protein
MKNTEFRGDRKPQTGFVPTEANLEVAVQFFNWKPGQAQGWGSDISRGWTQKPRQARVTVKR